MSLRRQGTPQAIASSTAMPWFSTAAGNTKTSPAANAPRLSSIQPMNVTLSGGSRVHRLTVGLACGPLS